jgi:hypothetical protein
VRAPDDPLAPAGLTSRLDEGLFGVGRYPAGEPGAEEDAAERTEAEDAADELRWAGLLRRRLTSIRGGPSERLPESLRAPAPVLVVALASETWRICAAACSGLGGSYEAGAYRANGGGSSREVCRWWWAGLGLAWRAARRSSDRLGRTRSCDRLLVADMFV